MASVLVIGFLPAFRPTASGGEQRLSRLYRAVSEMHDVTLLTRTDVAAHYEEIQHNTHFRELRFPKDEHWRQACGELDPAGVNAELSGLAFALAVSDPNCVLRRRARELAMSSDVVVHESPYSEPIFSDGCPCLEIYNAHHVEACVLSTIVTGPGFEEVLLRLLKLEGNLAARAQRVFTTSAENLDKFRLFYGAPPAKLGLCPNGFDPEELAPVVLNRGARAASLETPAITASSDRPQVLALNDYSVLGLRSGGAARIRALLTRLDCDVVLVTFGATFELAFISAGVLSVTVPKTAAHFAFESALNSGQPVSADDVAASLFATTNPTLTAVVGDLARRSQAVIFEHPYLAPLLDVLAMTASNLPVIYSAHNVEAEYKKPLLASHSSSSTLLAHIGALERRLLSAARQIVCCTDEDARALGTSSAEALVVPNGCDLPPAAPSRVNATLEAPTRVGFMGSSHPPNVAGANFIREVLAPAFPHVQFELLGDVYRGLSGSLPTNLVTHGAVDESRKSDVLWSWDIALNPVATGGGSSLKLADYLAHGLATLNTPTGARGFAIAARDCGRIAPLEDFPSALTALLANAVERRALADRARSYAVECLCWRTIADPYRRRLRELIEHGLRTARTA
jgi:glycosyltransferase involved in cell wall biosynthesis